MDYSQLDSLMTIPKKGDASQAKKGQYNELIKKILDEEGYSKRVEMYIYGGFSFNGSLALAEYIISLTKDRREEIYSNIITGELFYKNEKGITFKILISLLGHLLNKSIDDSYLIQNIIKKIPGLSMNKEQKRWRDMVKTIEKYFITELVSDAKLPPLSNMEINPSLLTKFKNIIYESIASIKPSDSKEVLAIDTVCKWLGDNWEGEKEKPVDLYVNNVILSKDENISNDEEEKSVSNCNGKKIGKKNVKKSELLKSIANYLDSLEKEVANLRITRSELTIKNSILEKDLLRLNDELKAAELDLADMIKQKEALYQETLSLKGEANKLTKKAEELVREIQKRNTILSVFETDKESSQRECLNAIASKLKAEYQDFKDSIDMEMTIELGKNMRQQLMMVFRTLAKNGIDIEGRNR